MARDKFQSMEHKETGSAENKNPISRRQFLTMVAGAASAAVLNACVVQTVPGETGEAPAEGGEETAAAPAEAGVPVSVRYWYWADDPQDPTFNELVDEFNASHPGIQLEPELIGWNDFHNKLLTSMAANDLPDAARFKEWWLGEFVEAGMLEPMEDYIDAWPAKDDVLPNIWDLQRLSPTSPVYMMPWQALYLYLYYRTDWFEEEGLEPPNTTEEFLEAAQIFTSPPDRYGFGMRGARGGHNPWTMFTYAQGLRYQDAEGNIVLDNQDAIDANQWYLDLYLEEQVTPPSAPADGFAEVVGGFEAGKTAMIVHHIGSSNRLVETLGDSFSAIPVPEGPGGRFSIAAIDYNAMFNTSENKEQAFTFVSWLSETEQNDKWVSGTGVLPVVTSLADKYSDLSRFHKASVDSAPYAGVLPLLPTLGQWTEQIWPATMQQALNEQIDSATMMQTLADGLRGEE